MSGWNERKSYIYHLLRWVSRMGLCCTATIFLLWKKKKKKNHDQRQDVKQRENEDKSFLHLSPFQKMELDEAENARYGAPN